MPPDEPPQRLFKKESPPPRERRLRQPRYVDDYVADNDYETPWPIVVKSRRKRKRLNKLDDRFSPSELRQIARWQGLLKWYIIVVLFGGVFAVVFIQDGSLQNIRALTAAYVVTTLMALAPIARLAFRLSGIVAGVVYVVLAIWPCIGFIAVANLQGRAAKTLKDHGVRSGWFGVNRGDLARLDE